VGQFLGYYAQYTLEDLETMPTHRFVYLMGAMLDNTDPDQTDPVSVVAARKMRAKVLAARNK